MAPNSITKSTAAVAAALLLSAGSASAADGFSAITTDFGNSTPTGVVLPSICIGNFDVAKTMYTFEPVGVNDTVSVLTKPADLVETGIDEDTGNVFLKFNLTVAEVTEDAGVIIKFPADQLESVNICCTQSAQIKPGFTHFKSLVASTSSSVNATFGAQETDLAVVVQSDATVNVKVAATEESKVGIVAETEATIGVEGNITVIKCLEESECKVEGYIDDASQSLADGSSTIKTPTCEGIEVKDGSTCVSKMPYVKVVTSGPLVFSGIKEHCYGGEDLYGVNGPAPTDVPTVSPAPTISAAPTGTPSFSPSKSPTISDPETAGAMQQGLFMSALLSGSALLLLLWQ